MKQEGEHLFHTHCLECSSSDGLSIYLKKNDEGEEYNDAFCWVCENYFPPSVVEEHFDLIVSGKGGKKLGKDYSKEFEQIEEMESRGVSERKIKKKYCEMYGMKVSYDSEGKIDKHYYPYHKDNNITGYKVRAIPKEFHVVGDIKKCQLFGQNLFTKNGEYANRVSKKFVILTESELDTIAMQQAMSDNGNSSFINAVVGLPNGANTRAVKDNYDFLNEFEHVIIALDQDDAGKKAAKEIAKILPMGKGKIASFREKDPADMVRLGYSEELSKIIWTAKTFTPSGIIAGEGLWEAVSRPLESESIDYPWKGLNEMVHGIRTSELVTLVSGSGMGKSEFARAIMYHILKTTDDNVGSIFLEESVRKTGLALMSFEAKKLLHLPYVERTEEEMRNAFNATLGTGRVFLFDSFGSNDIDTICENIAYFAKVADCKYIFLDHISIMVSGGGYGDERKALDEIATKLRTLVQELQICLVMVSHLKRVDGAGHEGGERVSLNHIRGSGGPAQLSDIVIGLERNNQHEDPEERNTTTLRVLKNRFSGETGVATRVHFNSVTGELTEVAPEKVDEFVDSEPESEFDEELFSAPDDSNETNWSFDNIVM